MKPINNGFTLVELMIVVSIIALIAGFTIPNLLSSKVAANQGNALSTVRGFMTAQMQFKTLSVVDADVDGQGEFGSIGEMSGAVQLDARGAGSGVPRPLDPPVIQAPFELLDAQGFGSKHGYHYRIFLPDAALQGLPEQPNGGPHANVEPDNAEFAWSLYAWPITIRNTGNLAYFVDHRGQILTCAMGVTEYSGNNAPMWNAALNGVTMISAMAISGNAANDGNEWVPLR